MGTPLRLTCHHVAPHGGAGRTKEDAAVRLTKGGKSYLPAVRTGYLGRYRRLVRGGDGGGVAAAFGESGGKEKVGLGVHIGSP